MPRFNLIDLNKYHHFHISTFTCTQPCAADSCSTAFTVSCSRHFAAAVCRRMEQPLLASSNVVQYGNQNTIVFALPPTLPEIRNFLMNGGGLLPVKAGMKQSSVYMFKQSCLRVGAGLFATCKGRCLGSLTLAKPHALLHNSNGNHKSFQLLHVWRLEHDG